MNKAKRIIRKHVANASLSDSIISTVAFVSFLTSSIYNFLEIDYAGLDDAGRIVIGTVALIDVLIGVFLATKVVGEFRRWRQTPERAAAYEHLATASVAELEARIHKLEQHKATAESEISALRSERSQLQKEYDAKLTALDKQIDSQEDALRKANYNSEIELLEQLIRAQHSPRFFRQNADA